MTIQGRGRGGRNQEMALAAALELEGQPRVCALFAGTDGTDGPTDAAGGFAFSDSVARMGGREAARALLAENNSNAALALSGDLLITGADPHQCHGSGRAASGPALSAALFCGRR